MTTKADQAVAHIIRQMQRDGRLAYLLGWGSQSFNLLTDAYAEANGLDVEKFRDEFSSWLRPEKVITEE
jgi:hypothetical protein